MERYYGREIVEIDGRRRFGLLSGVGLSAVKTVKWISNLEERSRKDELRGR